VSTRLRLDMEYEGTEFAGWQVQPGLRTVQGELNTALSTILRTPVRVIGAGRTDAGVHARGQVGHADVPDAYPPLARILAGVRALTGPDLLVREITVVPGDFHARFSARARTYEYRIALVPSPLERRFQWFVPYRLDVGSMSVAAQKLEGRYPATCWCSSSAPDTTAIVHVQRTEIERRATEIVFRITSDRFVTHMVRTIVGTLVEIGRGVRSPEDIGAIISSQDRARAGPTAPAHGLCLQSVEY